MIFHPRGICAREIQLDIADGTITNLQMIGGCDGNHKGLSQLVVGSPATEIANKLEGIRCGAKNSSCPDQIAKAIRQYLAEHAQ